MKSITYDSCYNSIVDDILTNKEFNKIKYIEHHGVTRYEHSIKVSYYSYKIANILNLSTEEIARAGLLHDFFLSKEDRTLKEKFLSTFVHPKTALETSNKYFDLTDREKNIIESHMFPLYTCIPRYKESFVVSLVDKVVGSYEFMCKFQTKFKYATNLYILVLFGIFK